MCVCVFCVLWDENSETSIELNMEFCDTDNDAIRCRTKRITKIAWAIFALVFFIIPSNATHIDFDDVETAWLGNVVVHLLPASGIRNQTMPLLKVTGLASVDIEDGIRIKATLSSTNCLGNETDLQIINDAPSKNSINRNITDLIVALDNFNFKRQSTAYLCIQTKYDHRFQHMGDRSKFPK